jgi:hypothetical protein
MADNAPVDVIRSHQDDDRDSVVGSTPKHEHEHDIPPQVEPQTDPDEKYKRDVPPDGGYGWVCVACVFWINAHTWGINSVSISSLEEV